MALATFVVACGPGSSGSIGADVQSYADVAQEYEGAAPLIHASRWEIVAVEDDVIRDPALDPARQCPPEAMTVEVTDDGLYLDVDTTDCGWLTLTQTSLLSLLPGDILRIWGFRWPNVTAEGLGRFTVAAGDPPTLLWEVRPELPQERSELFYEDISVPRSIPAGTPLYWHVSNHGQNVWSMVQLLRVH